MCKQYILTKYMSNDIYFNKKRCPHKCMAVLPLINMYMLWFVFLWWKIYTCILYVPKCIQKCVYNWCYVLYTNKGEVYDSCRSRSPKVWMEWFAVWELFLQIQNSSFQFLRTDLSPYWTELETKLKTFLKLAPFDIISFWGPIHCEDLCWSFLEF